MTKSELAELVKPLVVEEGFELVDCSVSRRPRGQTFRVSIDREDGVPVSACAEVSRRIARELEKNPVLAGGFEIEVSSSGMNRPVWTLDHFRRFRGEGVKVQLRDLGEGAAVILGDIGELEADGFWVQKEDGEGVRLRLEDIESAQLRKDPWKRKPGRKTGSC